MSALEVLPYSHLSGITGTPRAHKKLLENFVQLKVDNKLLAEENARLASELAEVQNVRGGITTVPVPGMLLLSHTLSDIFISLTWRD